jgi:Fe-S-cluster-containing hydrogenase component 2
MKILRAQREICSGCEMCLLACSLAKTGTINPFLARIRLNRTEEGRANPIICRHCKNAPCLKACPIPGAMEMDIQTGVVLINEEKCISCLDCVDACPFGAIWVGPNREMLKCDLCGGSPTCVKYCPPRPDNSLPHLPWPEQSCLQYIEGHIVRKNKRQDR